MVSGDASLVADACIVSGVINRMPLFPPGFEPQADSVRSADFSTLFS